MKKWIAMLLIAALSLSAAACRRETPPTSDPTDSTPQQAALAGTMEENITAIVQANPAEFMGGLMPLDLKDTSEEGLWALKRYTGLDSPAELTDVAVYEAVTGAQAFSLVMARVAPDADAKAVARKMKDNIDPAKWICVSANQVMAAGYRDAVMFIMLNTNLGKTAQSYVDAFKNLCGGKLDFTI